MDILVTAFAAVWQVLAVGLLLGAGLPALFALGLRSLSAGRTVTVGATAATDSSRPSPAGIAGAIVCFGIAFSAVAFGIFVIVFGQQLFGADL